MYPPTPVSCVVAVVVCFVLFCLCFPGHGAVREGLEAEHRPVRAGGAAADHGPAAGLGSRRCGAVQVCVCARPCVPARVCVWLDLGFDA